MSYTLPPLPYPNNALEPHYDAQTVALHHDKHHAAYVAGLNKAEDMLATAREKSDYGLIKHWERELAFHGAGHILHTLFWENMTPKGGGQPSGALLTRIQNDFGGFDPFKAQFAAAAAAVEGSGWCLLAWDPSFKKLVVLQIEKHQDLCLWGAVPLLVLDVWEHAYYLKFQNRRAEWIDSWWNLVNWTDVAARFKDASK